MGISNSCETNPLTFVRRSSNIGSPEAKLDRLIVLDVQAVAKLARFGAELDLTARYERGERSEVVGWTEKSLLAAEGRAQDGEIVIFAEQFAEVLEFRAAESCPWRPEITNQPGVVAVVFDAFAPIVKILGVVGLDGGCERAASAVVSFLLPFEDDFPGISLDDPALNAAKAAYESGARGFDSFGRVFPGDGPIPISQVASDRTKRGTPNLVGERFEELVKGLHQDIGIAEAGEAVSEGSEEGVFDREDLRQAGAGDAEKPTELLAALARLMNGFCGREIVQVSQRSRDLLAGNATKFFVEVGTGIKAVGHCWRCNG